jgi:hypothetical protein
MLWLKFNYLYLRFYKYISDKLGTVGSLKYPNQHFTLWKMKNVQRVKRSLVIRILGVWGEEEKRVEYV